MKRDAGIAAAAPVTAGGALLSPCSSQARMLAGSITASISKVVAMLMAEPLAYFWATS